MTCTSDSCAGAGCCCEGLTCASNGVSTTPQICPIPLYILCGMVGSRLTWKSDMHTVLEIILTILRFDLKTDATNPAWWYCGPKKSPEVTVHDVTCIYFVKMVYKSTTFKYLPPLSLRERCYRGFMQSQCSMGYSFTWILRNGSCANVSW